MRHIPGMLLAMLALPAGAQDGSGLTALETADDAAGWEAVGRIDIGTDSFCTGALIAPDLVLTAAHCLFDRDTGARIDPATMEFLAGMRNGRALAYRDVRLAVAHPAYVQESGLGGVNQYDLAILQLAMPIRLAGVQPFDIAPPGSIGTEVGVVSYAFDRAEAPSLQEVCAVIGQQDGVIVMSCDVDFGSSGAPVFREGPDGVQIVSVVSAKAELGGQRVAVGAMLDEPLAELRAELAAVEAQPLNRAPGDAVFLQPGDRGTGARFVRP